MASGLRQAGAPWPPELRRLSRAPDTPSPPSRVTCEWKRASSKRFTATKTRTNSSPSIARISWSASSASSAASSVCGNFCSAGLSSLVVARDCSRSFAFAFTPEQSRGEHRRGEQIGVARRRAAAHLEMRALVVGRLDAHQRRAVLHAPAHVGRREGVGLDPVVAVRRRVDERHHRRRMGEHALGEGGAERREAVLGRRVEEGVLLRPRGSPG